MECLKKDDYHLVPFIEYLEDESCSIQTKILILRHDIDRYPEKALRIAEIENALNIRASYYFTFEFFKRNNDVIDKIKKLGHEIGYHYNELSRSKGNIDQAISYFDTHLEFIRKSQQINTICMDGRPVQKFDNRDLWNYLDYKKYGVKGEIYLDVNYDEFAYFTDTSRTWLNQEFNVRDMVYTNKEWIRYKSSKEIIKAIENGSFPQKAVLNVHPEHWSINAVEWYQKLIWQFSKNAIKYVLLKLGCLKKPYQI
jgi:hypothetical protein